MKKFLVIDTFGIIYRYYYIMLKNPLVNSKGENTSAIFGFLRTYFSLIEKYPADYTCIALDSTRDTFRQKIYPEYKANRESMPEDLRSQIPLLYELIDAMHLPKLRFDDFEADDIVGTIAELNKKEKVRTIIYSPDKDVMQLVDDNTVVIASDRENNLVEYDREGVFKRRGVYPERIIDLLALMGDASDNIPGVPGVGEKTALKLITDFGSLDGVYENIEVIQGKLKEKLVNGREKAYLSRELCTIKRDIDIGLPYSAFEKQAADVSQTLAILDRLELRAIRKKVEVFIGGSSAAVPNEASSESAQSEKFIPPAVEKPKADVPPVHYYLIENEAMLSSLLADLAAKRFFAMDFETTGLDVFASRIIGISFSMKAHEAFYIDLSGRTPLDREKTLAMVWKTVTAPGIRIVGQNLKFEYKVCRAVGVSLDNIYFDTMIASYLINPGQRYHNMDFTAKEYLGYDTLKYKDITDNATKTLLDVDLDTVLKYACEDADITFRLYEYCAPKLTERDLEKLFFELEMPLVKVLACMEYRGVYIDTGRLAELSDDYGKRLASLEKKVFAEAGKEFNLGSPKQIAETLFDHMQLEHGKKTKTGYSTDEEVLAKLAEKHAIARHLMEHRTFSKLKNTYVDVLPTLVNKATGRIHTSYNQTVAATGRLSSSDPNLQNIPVIEEGRSIRRAFRAPEGTSLISADYSQIELRVLAHVSGDKALAHAFASGEDIHRKTAMRLYSVSEKNVTPSMRHVAKIINFSIVYGKTPFGLSKELGISRAEADQFIKSYFAMYASVKDFTQAAVDGARDKGYVETIMGRRRTIENIASRNATLRAEAERIAVNTVVQGSAADLIKIAMADCDRELAARHPDAYVIMQVHDELVIETPTGSADAVAALIKHAMEDAMHLSVPLIAQVHVGENWGDIH
ncbi:MAG: DNA polymerase I [Spirochaetota bacterium]